MNLPYLMKGAAFHLLRILPLSAHEFLSTKVTRRGIRNVERDVQAQGEHARILVDHFRRSDVRLLEFGAGNDLFSNLFLATRGFSNQITVDIARLTTPEYLNRLVGHPTFAALGERRFTADFENELRGLGITYRAPFDIRRTDLPTGSIDAVVSTNTLEHIPVEDIKAILRECRRLIRPGGICSLAIDYTDHYSHTDRAITEFNFLRFGETAWRLLSPPNHYQNRLRHRDYRHLFLEAGFGIGDDKPMYCGGWEERLRSLRLHARFAGYAERDLGTTSGWFVLTTDRDMPAAETRRSARGGA